MSACEPASRRRAGYATDSRYPLKLIELMGQHGFYHLDEVDP